MAGCMPSASRARQVGSNRMAACKFCGSFILDMLWYDFSSRCDLKAKLCLFLSTYCSHYISLMPNGVVARPNKATPRDVHFCRLFSVSCRLTQNWQTKDGSNFPNKPDAQPNRQTLPKPSTGPRAGVGGGCLLFVQADSAAYIQPERQ